MQPKEQISKASWTLIEGSKDVVAANLTNAIRAGKIKVDAKQVPLLLMLINASVDEGYHRGHKTFIKCVDKALNEEAMPAMIASKANEKKVGKRFETIS